MYLAVGLVAFLHKYTIIWVHAHRMVSNLSVKQTLFLNTDLFIIHIYRSKLAFSSKIIQKLSNILLSKDDAK